MILLEEYQKEKFEKEKADNVVIDQTERKVISIKKEEPKKDIEKINGSQKMADYHENFISNYTQKLLNDAIKMNEIENIDTKAFSILLGGIGREFLKEKNRYLINTSPEESANSITSIILNGIKLKD